MNDYYDYGSYSASSTVSKGILAGFGVYMIFMSVITIFMLICMWKIYKKAGKKGWESIIPIYNIIVLLDIVQLPAWYIVLFFVPIANVYALFKIYIELAHKFGKSTGFGIASVFFSVICLPILAFGNNSYCGNNAQPIVNNGIQPAPSTPMNDMIQQPAPSTPMNDMMQQPVQSAPMNDMMQQPVPSAPMNDMMQQPAPSVQSSTPAPTIEDLMNPNNINN